MTLSNMSKTTSPTSYPHIWALIIATVLIIGSCFYYLQQQNQNAALDKQIELATIADLKASQISQWRKEHLTQAASIHSNALMSQRISDFLNGKEKTLIDSELRVWMSNLHETAGYRKVVLFKPNGDTIAVVADDNRPPERHELDMVTSAASHHKVLLSDFHIDNSTGIIDIDLVIPIMNSRQNPSGCVAVLLLDIDPHTFLYPLIQSWPAPSKTGETLLVKRDGNDALFLNDLKFMKNSALRFRRPLSQKDMPASRAALGQEGIFKGRDYRGVQTLSAIRTIPGSPWALVAKIDASEIFAPVSKWILYIAASCIMLVVSMWMGVSLWWGKKSAAYHRTLYETELKHNNDLKIAKQSLHEAHTLLELRVAQRTGELSEANARLRKEMAEREQLEQRLLEAKRLESIGQIASGVAHEVRNPLNAILTITEALFMEQEIENNPEYKPYLEHVRTQVTRLAHLMNDLLELGKPILRSSLQRVPLYTLCCETLTLWESSGLSENRRAMIKSGHGTETALVMADQLKLQQVFFNLLENAGHNSPRESRILLHLKNPESNDSLDGMATIQIIDEGRGIPPDKITRIFDPFYSNRKGGTGLGLTLVKHYIENMGGTVRIWNNDPPPGCTAEIRIPLVRNEEEEPT